MYQNAILADQRNEVCHGAQRHEVEQCLEVVGVKSGQAQFAPVFNQGVCQLEGQAR